MSNSKSLSEERFNQFADGYVNSQTHAKGADLARLVAVADPQADESALDIATGGGHTALAIAAHARHVTVSDMAETMLAKAEAHIRGQGIENVSFQRADAENLPFDDATFDLVTCRIAPHHFPNPGQFVQEAARVLKPGGRFVVQDHVLPEDFDSARYVDSFEKLRDPSHNRGHSQAEWVAMFEAAGLTVSHTEVIIKRHDFMDWAARQGCTEATIEQLISMMRVAPSAAADWMAPLDWGTEAASFANRHLIIRGDKAE